MLLVGERVHRIAGDSPFRADEVDIIAGCSLDVLPRSNLLNRYRRVNGGCTPVRLDDLALVGVARLLRVLLRSDFVLELQEANRGVQLVE